MIIFNKETFLTMLHQYFFIISLHRILLRHFINNMRRIVPIIVIFISIVTYGCTNIEGNQEKNGTALKDGSLNQAVPVQLTYNSFLKKIWNFEKNPQKWIYEGDEPSVIDFYADWCGPCKRVAPIMDEMARKYNGKVKFYKVNVDKENRLASVFQIRSIPAVLFIPKKGKPLMQVGLLPHDTYIQIIDEQLLHKKYETKKKQP